MKKLKNSIVVSNHKDNHISILNKIIEQKDNKSKIYVYLMFKYTKPQIVDSKLFLICLWLTDAQFFWYLKSKLIKRNRIIYWTNLLYRVILYSIPFTIIFCIFFGVSVILMTLIFKLMEFIVKLLNGNLENFDLFEDPLMSN